MMRWWQTGPHPSNRVILICPICRRDRVDEAGAEYAADTLRNLIRHVENNCRMMWTELQRNPYDLSDPRSRQVVGAFNMADRFYEPRNTRREQMLNTVDFNSLVL